MKEGAKAKKGKGSKSQTPKGKGQKQAGAPKKKVPHHEMKAEGPTRRRGSGRRKVRATPVILIGVALLVTGIGIYYVFRGTPIQVFFALVIAVVCGVLGVLFLKGDRKG